jgi:hypothetical protein
MRSMIWSAVLVHLKGRAVALQLGEPPLDLADPGGVGRGEVQLDAGMGEQPLVDHGRLVGGQVVADHVDGQAGLGLPVDLIITHIPSRPRTKGRVTTKPGPETKHDSCGDGETQDRDTSRSPTGPGCRLAIDCWQ